jgi:tight adherence protein B
MFLAFLVFVLGAGAVIGGYAFFTYAPKAMARRRMDQRLSELVSSSTAPSQDDESIVRRTVESPLPMIDRMVERSGHGSTLAKLIEQSGIRTTPGAIVGLSIVLGLALGSIAMLLTRQVLAAPVAFVLGGGLPFAFLVNRRSHRMKVFEEQFPEALDLLSRALRAGHAFQTALGMVGDELKAPVGPEFKKTFDQQNFGLPLRDALNQLVERVSVLDVKFFVTAVLIQRETGGNLSEILDNLAHVVRERFKIRRQVRVHTAHGRFTAYVLLSLPAVLAIALSMLNPDHMGPLFHERMGQMSLMIAMVMQAIGFVWIRKVIKIEV